MKDLICFIVYVMSFLTAYSQSFRLTTGLVFKYNEKSQEWSEQPLQEGDVLNYNDSIKAYTPFQIEIPSQYRDMFDGERFFNTYAQPEGARLTHSLKQKTDRYRFIQSNSTYMDVRYYTHYDSVSKYISWLMDNLEIPIKSQLHTDLYYSNTWEPVSEISNIELKSSVKLTITNTSENDAFVYMLWGDSNKWNAFWQGHPDRCLRISPYSSYTTPDISLSEPLGMQSIMLISGREKFPDSLLFNVLNKDNQKMAEKPNGLDIDVIQFNLIK